MGRIRYVLAFKTTMTLLHFLALVLALLLTTFVAKRVDWSAFNQDKSKQHLLFGSSAAIFALWWFRAGIFEGLDVHFLWLSALTLMLGFRLALIAALVALVGTTLVGNEAWNMLGVNALLGVFLPIGLTYLIFMVAFHRLPRHLFVYIFICAFFPGAITIAAKMAALSVYYWLGGIYSWDVVFDNYLLLTPLMLFPEAMLNGMTMTLLVIYKPDWVYCFHDKFYLDDA